MKLYLYFVLIATLLSSLDANSENRNKIESMPPSVKNIDGKIQIKLSKWLKYYDINLSQFILTSSKKIDFRSLESDTSSLYYREFNTEDDIYSPLLHDYSPNKKFYVNLLQASGVYKEDGKYYYYGGDDCQEIYLVNRKNKTCSLILWLGSLQFCEAAFWYDNNTIILAGRNNYDDNQYFLYIFDLKKSVSFYYTLEAQLKNKRNNYFEDINLKTRGILTE